MLNINRISELTINNKKPVCKTGEYNVSNPFKNILPQDTFIKVNEPKAVFFKGLTRDLSNNLYKTREQVMQVVDKYLAKNKGIAGSMPDTWIKKIPEATRSKAIKEVYSKFAEAVDVLNNNGVKTQEASKILTTALVKASIMKANDTVNLEFINYGSFGTGYLLEVPVNDVIERYVLKISPEKRFNDKRSHGIHLETNRALYLAKNAGKDSDRAPFYFADFNSGYMMVSCVDGTLPKPKSPDLQRFCLSHNDDSDNTIYQHKIEYGGLFITTPAAKTKTSRWAYKQVFDAPVDKKEQVWLDLYNDKTLPNREEVELGLAATVKFLINKDHYTDLLLNNNPSNLVKLGLLNKSSFMDGYKYYDQIMEDADIEVRIRVAAALPGYHPDRMESFVSDCMNYLQTIDVTKRAVNPLTPTAKDLITVLLGLTDLFKVEDKIKIYDQLLLIADDEIKALVAKNLYSIYDQRLKQPYFDKLASGASVDVINALIPSLTKIDNSKAKLYFKEFAQIENDETRALLVKASSIYSGAEQLSWLVKLAKDSGPKTQYALMHAVKQLPEDERFAFIDKNLPEVKNLSTESLIQLVHNIYSFSKEEGYKIYDTLTEDLTAIQPKLLEKLFIQLKYFHDDRPKQEQMFRKFAMVDNKALRSKMIKTINIAPEDFKVEFIKLCAKGLEGKDGFLVNRIIEQIQLLPSEEIVSLYKEFYSFNEPNITDNLIYKLEYLPKDAIGRCYDIFVPGFKSLNKELQDHLMSLIHNSKTQHSISASSKKTIKFLNSTDSKAGKNSSNFYTALKNMLNPGKTN